MDIPNAVLIEENIQKNGARHLLIGRDVVVLFFKIPLLTKFMQSGTNMCSFLSFSYKLISEYL